MVLCEINRITILMYNLINIIVLLRKMTSGSCAWYTFNKLILLFYLELLKAHTRYCISWKQQTTKWRQFYSDTPNLNSVGTEVNDFPSLYNYYWNSCIPVHHKFTPWTHEFVRDTITFSLAETFMFINHQYYCVFILLSSFSFYWISFRLVTSIHFHFI